MILKSFYFFILSQKQRKELWDIIRIVRIKLGIVSLDYFFSQNCEENSVLQEKNSQSRYLFIYFNPMAEKGFYNKDFTVCEAVSYIYMTFALFESLAVQTLIWMLWCDRTN